MRPLSEEACPGRAASLMGKVSRGASFGTVLGHCPRASPMDQCSKQYCEVGSSPSFNR